MVHGATENESSAEMYFTGQSLQEHCEHNPCYLCNEFDEPHIARHHNIKKLPPEVTTRYNTNRENWMVVKGPVQRGMPGQDAESKRFLAQRLSVANVSPIIHLHGRAFVTALLNVASGLTPYPSLKALRQNATAGSVPVAPTVNPTSAQSGGAAFQQGFQVLDLSAKFVFGSTSTAAPAHGVSRKQDNPAIRTKGRKRRGCRSDCSEGTEVAGAVGMSPTEVARTQGTSLPVATFAPTPGSSSSLFPAPVFNIGQPGPHQQMDMQWRLQVQQSITTLQQGQVHLERSVTSLQVESSVSTYMMSLHLVNQGWTEAQIEEKLQAKRKRQL